jgi:hypothetical protein
MSGEKVMKKAAGVSRTSRRFIHNLILQIFLFLQISAFRHENMEKVYLKGEHHGAIRGGFCW